MRQVGKHSQSWFQVGRVDRADGLSKKQKRTWTRIDVELEDVETQQRTKLNAWANNHGQVEKFTTGNIVLKYNLTRSH